MGMPVGQLMREMSALEETYWIAFTQECGPIGDDRADLRSAQVCQLLYDIHAGKKSQRKKITDWLMFYRKRVKEDPDISTKIKDRFSQLIDQGKK